MLEAGVLALVARARVARAKVLERAGASLPGRLEGKVKEVARTLLTPKPKQRLRTRGTRHDS